MIFSCSGPEKTKEENAAPVKKDSLVSAADTFHVGTKIFYVEQISKADFDNAPGPFQPDSLEKNILIRDSIYAFRLGSVLILNMNGRFEETISFKDNTKEGTEGFCQFTYKGFLPEINQYVVFGAFVESFNYFLIDKATADTSFACGFPIMSPGKKHFICGNTDLMARFVPNGFDLYEVVGKKIHLVGRRELDKWGPEKIKWLNDSSLLVQRNVLDTTSPGMIKTDYVKLLMN
ncbi:MAG TPA: hypothetical protein VNY73_02980 [Bacteroidia bacterium]|nr:hypothetical protein [Bacteroidia bacterium]